MLVVIIILVTLNSEETGAKDTGIKTEQNKGDTDTQEAKDEINASDKAQQNDNYDGGDKESEKDEGILKDDITWGDIY